MIERIVNWELIVSNKLHRVTFILAFRFVLIGLPVTLLLCSSAIAQQGIGFRNQQESLAFHGSPGTGSVRVPFDLYGNNILIQVRLNNSLPIWFVFDTGAGMNVINERTVKNLGLAANGSVTLNANGGTVGASFVEGVTISCAGISAPNQTLVAAPLDAMAASFGRDVQGLIGNNFIGNFVVEIDYSRQTLIFNDPKTYNLSGQRNAVELEEHDGNPFMKVELSLTGEDHITALSLIDTGSDGIFSINRPYAEKHQLLKVIPKAKMAEGVGGAGLGGDTKFINARISSIRLGQYTLANPVVGISQDTEGNTATADGGFIGTDLLRRFTVVLDYQSHRMLLTPNAHFKEPFEVDLSGLELITEAGDFKVIKIKKVRANLPAAQVGLREGDIITAVNGHPATEFDLDKLAKMLKQEGRRYRITVRRGNKVITSKLELKRVI